MSLVLDLTQLVLAVWKHLQMTNMIMFEDFYYYSFPRKSIPGNVFARGLHLTILGAGLGPDGPGSQETPSNYQYDHT